MLLLGEGRCREQARVDSTGEKGKGKPVREKSKEEKRGVGDESDELNISCSSCPALLNFLADFES